MSLSNPLKSLPVVHHFYPINPETALQQQSAVYNTPDHPLVAPILPAPSQPYHDASPYSNKKRKVQEIDAEIQYLGSYSSGRLSQTRKKSKHQIEPLQGPSESLSICLGPRQQRRTAYVELPVNPTIDLTLYRPTFLASSATQSLLGWGRHYSRARSVSQTSLGESTFSLSSPAESPVSEYLDPGDSIRNGGRQITFRRKKAESKIKAKDIEVLEDDATTCHQCRRKTTKEKMRCRRLRPDGSMCPYLFCHSCMVRYDEIFNSSHPTWHCPRCRGICNCSICLRKAGFGYILDGLISEQFTGVQGRLSVAGNRRKRGVMKGDQRDDDKPRVSVRAWLARKGIALGTEEWMMERRRQGVRYVVGKTPPPPDVPSPYTEAQFNPTIANCTDYFEDDGDDPSDEKPLCEGDADTALSSGPLTLNHSDATATSPTKENSNYEPLQTDMQPKYGTLNGMTAAETHEETGSHTLPLPHPDPDASAVPGSSEDLPGLSSAMTYGLRLIIGKQLPKSMGKKYQLKTPNIKKRKVSSHKRQMDVDVSDYEYDATTQQNVQAVQDDEKEEEKGTSPMSDNFHSPLHADQRFTPPPAEPVLVPTEYYAPSKLDATMATGSQAQFGHTYWSFNAVNPSEHRHEHHSGHDHGSSSSLLMSAPLYSNNDRQTYPLFSMGDMCPVGPSATEATSASTSQHGLHHSSESTSLSNSHTPDNYLNSQIHTHSRDVDAYTTHGLAAFPTLDETWAAVGMDPYPNLDIDISSLGIAQAVDVALQKRT